MLPQVDGYEILGELGRGGMGIVYKARQISLNRVVALKMLIGGAFAEQEHLARFRREAEAVARLQHPNIVQIFEVGVRRGSALDGFNCPYISLEFVEGGSLARHLGRLPHSPRESARIVETLARAVHYAHEHGIVHRDLKPANVLLTADGTPKLGDFGLAKSLDGRSDGTTLTGFAMGTPEYMSPEQASARSDVGPTSDVYSLGVILYEMLTGRRPFEGETALLVLDGVLREPPRPIRRLRPELPRDLEVICQKCLVKEPNQRYASAGALADDLARFQADEPIHARPQGAIERLGRWCRRKPLLAGMTAALITVFLLGFAAVTALWLLADARGQLAEEKGHLAEEKSREASNALDAEARTRAEGQLHIARLDAVSAGQLLEDGDLLAALPWLVEAMQLEEQGFALQPAEQAARERIHRARLAAALRQCPQPVQIWTHDRPLLTAFFSDDGKQVFTAPQFGLIRGWDTVTGEEKWNLSAAGATGATKFSLAAGLLAVGPGADPYIAFHDVATGQQIGDRERIPGSIRHILLSPDARRLLVAFGDSVQILDVSSRKVLWRDSFPRAGSTGVTAVAFTPDGRRVALAAGTEPELRDAETGEPVARLKDTGATTMMCCSPDGKLLATCGPNGARLWDVETGRERYSLTQGAGVWHAAFSPDGRFIVTAGVDGLARLWNSETGQGPLATFRHSARVVRVAFSPDGRRLLTASHDGTARVWDAVTGQPLIPPLRHTRPLVTAAFHPDGDRVLTAGDDGVARLWDVTAASHPAQPLHHASPVRYAAFNREGDRVATAADDGGVRVWDAAGAPVSPWLLQEERLQQVKFHPDGHSLLTVGSVPFDRGERGVVQTWDLDRWKPGSLKLSIGAGRVSHAGYSPNGSRVLLTGPFAANVWDISLQRDIVGINYGFHLRYATFSPDGSRVAFGTHVGFGVWEAARGQKYHNEYSDISYIAFSPDSSRLAVVGDNHTAGVFDAKTGKSVLPPLLHDGPVRHIAFSPDGQVIASAGDDRTARLWHANTGQLLLPPLQHRGPVSLVAFSADGQRLLTVCNVSTDRGTEGRVRWWDAATGEPLGPPLFHPAMIHHAAISQRGNLVVSACEVGGGFLWPTPEPATRPADDLRKLAEILSGQHLDPRLGPIALPHETLGSTWRELRAKYPDDFRSSPERLSAWQRFEVGECESTGQWYAAAWHLDRLLAQRPTDWELLARRAHVHYCAGETERVVAKYAEAGKLAPAQGDSPHSEGTRGSVHGCQAVARGTVVSGPPGD